MKLYVGNLVYNMTEAELRSIFAEFGRVVRARIISDFYTRQSKNFGYIEMSSQAEGLKAMSALNGKMVNNSLLAVKEVGLPCE